MTSSLVGSEMCIRDRLHTRRAPTCVATRQRRRWRLAFLGTDRSGVTATPVSYTHLTLPTICSV
eukprot:10981985-Prorocentrum_lima.AAC.1